MSSRGFSGFKALAKAVDTEVEVLEKRVKYGLTIVSQPGLSADIADEVLEEVQGMKTHAEALLLKLNEATSNMESLMKTVILEATEAEEVVKQVEAHAAQYGYIPQERKSLEQAYEDYLASSNDRRYEPDVIDGAASNEHVDSPNLLMFGFSKKTLKDLGYTFKEDLETDVTKMTKQHTMEIPAIDSNHSSDNLDSHLAIKPFSQGVNEIQIVADDNDDDFSPVSILKSRTDTKKQESSSLEMSLVEISPGLVVRRPSSRVTPKFQEKYDDEDFKPIVQTNVQPDEKKTVSPGGTPVTPVLKTFKWGAAVNIPAKGPTPRPAKISEIPSSFDPERTPPTPDLRTVDVRQLLQASALEVKPFAPKNSDPVKPRESDSTPEFPELATDMSKYFRSYQLSSQSNKENLN